MDPYGRLIEFFDNKEAGYNDVSHRHYCKVRRSVVGALVVHIFTTDGALIHDLQIFIKKSSIPARRALATKPAPHRLWP
jgi:hypothetical protein